VSANLTENFKKATINYDSFVALDASNVSRKLFMIEDSTGDQFLFQMPIFELD